MQPFQIGFFHFNSVHLRFICRFVAWSAYIILWLNNVLLYVCATVFLAIHLLKDILNASSLGDYE